MISGKNINIMALIFYTRSVNNVIRPAAFNRTNGPMTGRYINADFINSRWDSNFLPFLAVPHSEINVILQLNQFIIGKA